MSSINIRFGEYAPSLEKSLHLEEIEVKDYLSTIPCEDRGSVHPEFLKGALSMAEEKIHANFTVNDGISSPHLIHLSSLYD